MYIGIYNIGCDLHIVQHDSVLISSGYFRFNKCLMQKPFFLLPSLKHISGRPTTGVLSKILELQSGFSLILAIKYCLELIVEMHVIVYIIGVLGVVSDLCVREDNTRFYQH